MKTKLFKVLTALAVVAFVAVESNAQEQVFKKGDKDLAVGLGFGSPWITTGFSTTLPPVCAAFDYGLRDDWGPGVFGVGGYVSSSLYSSEYTWNGDKYGTRYLNVLVGARATYHYTFVENLDTYGGAILGFAVATASNYGDWPAGTDKVSAGTDPIHEIFVGAKYYFNPGFAVFSELTTGSSIPYFTMGVAFKF